MLDGIYQSLVCFGVALFVFKFGDFVSWTGRNIECIEDIGLFISSPTIFVINIFILMNQERLNLISLITWMFSIGVFWIWTFIYSEVGPSYAFHKSASRTCQTFGFWCVTVLTIALCLLPRFSYICLQKLFYPRDIDLLRRRLYAKSDDETSSSSSFATDIEMCEQCNDPLSSKKKSGIVSSVSFDDSNK